MKTYSVKEIYYTIQGEGSRTGWPAVFLRFAGCNLWSGREVDRDTAVCQFCDTDFFGTDGINGGKYHLEELVRIVARLWPEESPDHRYIVCTGGEPLLQLDQDLVNALKEKGFEVACETNGTMEPPPGLDWICMSPKANTEIIVRSGNEIKLIYPQQGIDPADFEDWGFDHFFLQPMDGPRVNEYTKRALEYCMQHPKWKLSIQVHKFLRIP